MASPANASFVSLVAHDEAVRLTGVKAQKPLAAGQMVIAHGTYEDGSETGAGIFLILRQVGAREYVMAPLGSADPYWEAFLAETPTVKAVLLRDASDAIPSDKELFRRWRIVSEAGEAPKKKDYVGFPKPFVDGLSKKWKFLNELVVSEKPPLQAGNDPPPPSF